MRRLNSVLLAIMLGGAPLQRLQPQGSSVSLNLPDARLVDVIRSVAAAAGYSVLLSDIPDRRISFSTGAPVPRADMGRVLESILEGNGLVAVREGSVVHIMPADRAPASAQLRVGSTTDSAGDIGLITQLVPLRSLSAAEAASLLRSIAGSGARIEPVPRTNSLLVTDRGANIARYLTLLQQVDAQPSGEGGLRSFVVPLKYAQAEDLAASLSQLFGIATALPQRMSLDDRSLGRRLDTFRQRELDVGSIRRDAAADAVAAPAVRDSAARAGTLVGQTYVVPHLPTNSLIIRTATPNFALLQETVQALDVRPAQVLLEVTVAEISLGRDDQFGIDWSAVGGSTTARLGTPAPVDSATPIEGLMLRVVDLRGANVRAVLRAIASRSKVRVLSTPEILAMNNREARIVVGSRVPFIASTRLGLDVAIDRSVQYQDVGTTLTIIPTINVDDYVSVQILQEVSALTSQTVQAALNAPVISTREAATRAIIRNNQTVVIGGLIGNQVEDVQSGVPLLMDIPVLGNLFKRRGVSTARTELAIFVTPHVVRTDADAEAIHDRIRDRMNPADPDSSTSPVPRKP